jgi:hypothetical protein
MQTRARDSFFFYSADQERAIATHSNNGAYRYGVRFVHQALGGPNGSLGEPISQGFIFCRDEPRDSQLDKYGCEPWRGTTMAGRRASASWVSSRKAWIDNDPEHAGEEHNEHALLAAYAAQLGGLPPTLKQTFFVSYPAPNRLIASKANNGGWIVGPSALPMDQEGDWTNTLRAYGLYELAQIPDWSFSVADWAGSNETCPLNRVEGGFPDSAEDPGNRRCHDYLLSIGPLNATHFSPASQSVYTHYHQLAMNRMSECLTLAAGLTDYYATLGERPLVWSPANTEAHECEREAMIYEMFAQHFLQDAWATGHMWHRWGYAEPGQFPYALDERYDEHWDDVEEVPTENVNGRRAVLAGTVAGFVGMVHGTKSVTEKIFRTAAAAGLLDDPLNGPLFDNFPFLYKPVKWQDNHGFSARGAGDLWASLIVGAHDEDYAPWRDRFLSCSAKSMRQVYQAGPKAHGPLISYLATGDAEDFDSFDDDCFSQRATNESMAGAVLPVPLAYDRTAGAIPIGRSVFGWANHLALKVIGGGAVLPHADDRERFLQRVGKRMLLDQMSVAFDYLANRDHGASGNRDGTESAQGRSMAVTVGDNRIKFLGVPPNQELPGSPPTTFMDRATPAVPEDERPDSHFLRRMFWRAHPEDTCEVPGLVADLRDACILGSAQPGGDPEACTRCVALAEQQMPGCAVAAGGENSPSKCAALGLESNGGIDPTYLGEQCATTLGFDNSPAYFLAFHYCLGTKPIPFQEIYYRGRGNLASAPSVQIDCSGYGGPGDQLPPRPFTPWSTERIAVGIFENASSTAWSAEEPPPTSFLSLIANAVQQTQTAEIYDEAVFCNGSSNPHDGYLDGQVLRSSLDSWYQTQIAPLALWDNQGKGLRALAPFSRSPAAVDDLVLEQCGVTQRVSYHNRDCSTALASLGRSDLAARVNQGYSRSTGTEVTFTIGSDELRCSVREEPQLKPVCARGSCNANGLCSAQEPPEVVRFYD